MAARDFAVFETAIGHAGIVWTARGICGVHLPEATADVTRAQLRRRFRDAGERTPPPFVDVTVERIRALLRGEDASFDDVPLDIDDVSEFQRSVYAIARAIPRGSVLTYGDVASRAGTPRDARAVGRALGANPVPIVVPCHRVVAAGGRMHGFSGPGGVSTKLRLLELEGYEAVPGPSLWSTVTPLAPANVANADDR